MLKKRCKDLQSLNIRGQWILFKKVHHGPEESKAPTHDRCQKLRAFKKDNKRKENRLHRNAKKIAKKIADKFGLKISEERIFPPYIVDLFIGRIEVAIEIDGGIHQKTQNYDERRDAFLAEKHGVTVLRFTEEDIKTGLFKKTIWVCCYRWLLKKIIYLNLTATANGLSGCIPDELKSISTKPF